MWLVSFHWELYEVRYRTNFLALIVINPSYHTKGKNIDNMNAHGEV